MDNKTCVLKSEFYPTIELPDGELVIIGRNPETKVQYKNCSKRQIKAIADYSTGIVSIEQLGRNPSVIFGEKLNPGDKIDIKNGDFVKLSKKTNAIYTLHFINDMNKRKGNDTDIPEASKKKVKLTDDSNEENLKKDADDDDDGKIQSVEDKLKMMQNTLKTGTKTIKSFFTTTNSPSAVANIQKYPIWIEADAKLYLFSTEGVKSSSKIAAFDLDGTLICTKSGKVFAENSSDWKILNTQVQPKLKSLLDDGYKIVIFTNQAGISRNKPPINEFRQKLESIVKKLSIPLQVFISSGHGIYRKPMPGMWTYMLENYNDNISVDMKSSYYVGDAAGRIEKWEQGRKKDFSTADRLFAINLNIPFSTPEEFFLGAKRAQFNMPQFDPREIGKRPLAFSWLPNKPYIEYDEKNICNPPEVIVFVGFPAAGKSFFAKKYLIPKNYAYVNRDTLGSWQKCVVHCEESLSKGNSVVIDNTSPDSEGRKRYITLAKENKVPCRCFYFDCNLNQAKHNNTFREVFDQNKSKAPVNDIILNSFKNKLKEPELSEGFSQIIKINFVPAFSKPEDEKLYKMFLVEK